MVTKNTYIVALVSLMFMIVASVSFAWITYRVFISGTVLKEHIAAIASAQAKEKANKDLTELIHGTEIERQTLDEYLLTEDTTSSFLTTIERIAQMQGVVVTTNSLEVVKPEKAVKKGAPVATSTKAIGTTTPQQGVLFQQLAIQFSIEGREEGVMKMLQVFENLPYHSEIKSFTLSRQTIGVAKSTIGLTVTLQK